MNHLPEPPDDEVESMGPREGSNNDDRSSVTEDASENTRFSKKAWITLVIILTLLGGGIAVFYVAQGVHSSPDSASTEAEAFEAKYDDKLARGDDGGDTNCADGNLPPSEAVSGVPQPPVLDRNGQMVGTIVLRTSASSKCPPVIWARVVWSSPNGQYTIPPELTLNVEAHRPDTDTVSYEPEATHTPIDYAFSAMLVTLRGCVFVRVFFSNSETKERVSTPAQTVCVRGTQGEK